MDCFVKGLSVKNDSKEEQVNGIESNVLSNDESHKKIDNSEILDL